MSGTIWVPGAERLTPAGTAGAMLHDAPPRAVWHTTEAPSGGKYFDLMARILVRKKFEPHLLYDPLTDRLGQFFALDTSARALQNDDAAGIHTNRTGSACIQIEVVAQAAKPFTAYWRPGPNFRALMAAIRSWGVPDEWPFGALSRAGESVSRDATTWRTRGGHCGHTNIPGNVHWDCGAIDQAAIFAAAQEDDLDAIQAQQLTDALNILKDVQLSARTAADALTPGKAGVKYDGVVYAQGKAGNAALAYLTKAVDGQVAPDGTTSKLALVLNGSSQIAASVAVDVDKLAVALVPHLSAATGGITAEQVTAAVHAGLADLSLTVKGA